MNAKKIAHAYALARERYAEVGVNTDKVLKQLARIPISLQCWQGDDVHGFENRGGISDGGIAATGNYPGRARNGDELRADLDQAFRVIPGTHRVNLHAIYAETGNKQVPRNELEPRHFSAWMDWAADRGLGLDYNGSFFSHPLAASGFTLSHRDAVTRRFWVEHGIGSRRIGAAFGRRLGTPCVTNVWIPDGYKDTPVDRLSSRALLKDSLDTIFADQISARWNLDALEGKLFGLGSESCVIGSHEFYLAYAVENRKLVCMDSGHYHPTESVADKLSSVLMFLEGILLHVSRGVRWDSDHVVVLNDDLRTIAEEIVRCNAFDRIHIGLDFFDASINRTAAWVIGTRNMIKALLLAMLEPSLMMRKAEYSADYTARLALLEEARSLPFTAVWDYYCQSRNVPVGEAWLKDVRNYEQKVQIKRQ